MQARRRFRKALGYYDTAQGFWSVRLRRLQEDPAEKSVKVAS